MTDRKEFVKQLTERVLEYSANIIHFVDHIPRDTSSVILSKQLIRSATSVGAYFVESQAAPSKKDFTYFISIALKSANETKYWLALFERVRKGNMNEIAKLSIETVELANLLGAIVRTSRRTM